MNALRKVIGLAAAVGIMACGDSGMGSLTFRARFPEHVTFGQAPASFRTQKFDDTLALTTVRLTALREGAVEATKDFAAADRQGELVNLAEGLYEIRVEGLVGSEVVLRAVKTDVRIESAKVRDAGEFFLAPVAPQPPLLQAAPAAVTNETTLTLAGVKEMFTGIRVNGADAVPPDDAGVFSVTRTLVEGPNAVKLVAYTEEGNESAALTVNVTLDRTPPKPVSFAIAGTPAAVSNPTVTLLIAADEAAEMMIAADSAFAGGAWIAYETSVTLTLADRDGAQTLYVKFRDRAGNESAALSTSVVLDRQSPAAPSVAVAEGALVNTTGVNLTLAAVGATEMQIGVDGAFGAWQAFAPSIALVLPAGDGLKNIDALFRDAAGNVASAKTTVTLDTVAPTAGSVAVSGAPTAVSNSTLSLLLAAAGAVEMQLSEDPAFAAAAWVPLAATSPFTLTGGDGIKTVYARFRDGAGNVSTAASTSVELDTTAPAAASVVAGAGAAYTNTQLVGLSIFATGAVEMQLAASPTFSGAAWQAYSASTSFMLPAPEGPYAVYARFRDAVGLVSSTINSNTVTLDLSAPMISLFEFTGSPLYAANQFAPVSLTALDASPLEMRFAFDPAFASATSWTTYNATPTVDLGLVDGLVSLYVEVRDLAGNVTQAGPVMVTLDLTPPSAPTGLLVTPDPSDGNFTLTWSPAFDAGGVQHYEIDESADAVVWNLLGTSVLTSYPLVRTAGSYYYRVRAVDNAGLVGGDSGAVSATVVTDTTAPVAGIVADGLGADVQFQSDAGNVYANWSGFSDDTAVTRYDMAVGTTPGGVDLWAFTPVGLTTSQTVPLSLSHGVTYYVTLRAFDAAGNFTDATSNGFTVDLFGPTVPNAPAVSPALTSGAYTVNWTPVTDPVSGVAYYEIWENAVPVTTVAAPPFVVAAAPQGTYYYQVRAYDQVGNTSSLSAASGSVMVDLTPPSAPSGLSVSPNPSTGPVTVSWVGATDGESGVAGYIVETSADGFTWSPAATTQGTSVGLALAQGLHYVRVLAIDAVNLQGPASGGTTVTIDQLPPVAGVVSDGLAGDVAFSNDGFNVYASWAGFSDNVAITNFDMGVGTAPYAVDVIPFINVGFASAATLSVALGDGAVLYTTIRAHDAAGNWVVAASNGFTVDLSPPVTPGAPAVSPNPTSTSATVSWAAVTDAVSGVAYYEVLENGIPVTTTAVTALFLPAPPQGVYAYAVRAVDAAGNASALGAASASLVVDQTPPLAPWSMSVAPSPASGPVTATWFAGSDGETGVAGYIVETSPDSFTWTPRATTTTTSASLSLGEGTHYVRAIAYDGVNLQSAPSDVYMVTIDQTPPTAGVVFDGPDFDLDYSNDVFAVTANWFAFSDNVTIATYHMAAGTVLFGNDLVDFTNVGYNSFATLSTSLSDGMTVYATVRAVDSAGNLAYATSNGFIVDATPPLTPGAPTVTPNPTTGPVTVTWAPVTDAASGIAFYEVWANGMPVTTTVATAVGLNMPIETMYVFSIVAYDVAGNASFGASAPSVIVDTTPPSAPTSLSLTPNPSTGPVNVSWIGASDAGSGVAGYVVETSIDGFTWSPLATTQATSVVLGLSDGTHYVRVIAYDNVGLQGPDSGGAMVTVDTLPPTAVAFSPSLGAIVNSPSVALDISAIGADQMQLSEDPAFGGAVWVAYAIGTDFALTPADGAKTVYIRFRDLAGNLSSALSTNVTVDASAPPVPAAPTVFPSPTSTGYTVAWAAVSDATGIAHYELWENGGWVTNAVVATVVISNPPEGSYTYQVRAIDGAGNASNTSASSPAAVVDRSAPNTPTAPTFSANPVSSAVTVSWGAVADAGSAGVQDYLLEQSTNGGGAWSLAAVTADTSLFVNLTSGNYLFRVAARDFAGNVGAFSVNSVSLAVSVSGPTNPSLSIAGSPAWVTNPNVLLLLSAGGATTYEVDENPGFAAPQSGPMTAATNFTLSGGDGLKTIFARFSNGVMYSSVVSASVSLDTVPPALTDATLAGGAAAVSTPTVTLNLAATGAFEMSVTGDAVAPKGWKPFQAFAPVTLATRNGRTVKTLGSASFARGVTVQSDGKIVVAGHASNVAEDWIVVRYNADGSLDNTFGLGGVVTIDFNALADFAYDVALRSDGKIFVAGTFNNGSKGVAAVQALNADGTPFNTYGPNANGRVFLNIGGSTNDGFTRIKFDGSDRLYAVGWTFNGTTAYDGVLARYDAAGTLDTSFNGQGWVTRDVGSVQQQYATLAIDASGRIVTGGYNGSDFLVARYAATGAPDTAFNGVGYVTTSIGANADTVGAVVIQRDGQILAVGQGNNGQNRIAMARYNPTGSLDTTFNGTGTVLTSFSTNDAAIGAVQLGDGKIFVGGRAGNDFFTARFNANGSIDNAYGQGGWRAIDVVGFTDTPAGFAVHKGGTALLVGQSNNGVQNHFSVAVADLTAGSAFGGFGTTVEGLKSLYIATRDQAGNLSSQLMRSVQFDVTPPAALAFSVQGSPAEVTTTNITLSTLMSESGQMQISESPAFGGAPWIAYSTTTPFALSPSAGTKTIYVRFRDLAGNVSGALSTSVLYRSFGVTSLSVGTGFDGDVVVLTGFGFGAAQGADFVRFGAANASVMGWSDTQLTVWVPTAAGPGNRPVTVDKGGAISNSLPFLVRPRIVTVSPNSGSGGTGVLLSGYNFGTSTATLKVGGMPVATSGWSMMNVNFTIPGDVTAGSQPIELFAAGVSSDTQWVSIYPNMVTLTPTTAQQGAVVTITGTNFGAAQGPSSLNIDALPVSTTTWTSNTIVFTVPPGAPAGAANVSVNVGGYPSNLLALTLKPVVLSVTPVTATSGNVVTIAGAAFGATKGGSQFLIGGAPTGEDSWSDTSITWTVPAALPGGSYPIQVQVNGQTSDPAPFFVNPNVTSLSAATTPVGAVLSIFGTNFGSAQTTSTVSIGGQMAGVQSWSSSIIGVWVPANLAPGTHPLVVTVGGRQSIAQPIDVSKGDRLVFTTAPQGPVPAGLCSAAETVEIRDGFGNAAPATSAVNLALAAPTVQFYSDNLCTVSDNNPSIMPPAASATFYYRGFAAGSESMTASAPGLMVAMQTAEIVPQAPTQLIIQGPVNIGAGQCAQYAVISVDPFGNPSNVGSPEPVSLGGQGAGAFFTDPGCGAFGSAVTIGAGTNNVAFWFQDPAVESLTLTASGAVLTGASYGVNVIPGGGANPSISFISPTGGAPNTTVTIYGSNFGASQGNSYVSFGGSPVTTATFWGPATVQVQAPFAVPGNLKVEVVVGGNYSNPATYENMQMHIDERYPAFGVTGTSVTLTGGYFGPMTGTVQIGGQAATVTGWSNSTVQVAVPPGLPSGNANIVVNNFAGDHSVQVGFTLRGSNVWVAFDEVPVARSGHRAVWTGSEMIVWGGSDDLNSGGRYNPALDTWTATSYVGAPTRRVGHTAVWTGRSMIVYGGSDSGGELGDGGSYDPWSDSWSPIASDAGRTDGTAVWTGRHMFVFGGSSLGIKMAAGRRYDPGTDTWSTLQVANQPVARTGHSAVWTGKYLIVWGGQDATTAGLGNGARYNPDLDQWFALPATGAPDPRAYHSAVWTGTEMLVWGGYADIPPIYRQDGARYNLAANTWTALPVDGNTPSGRESHTAVWTGQEMLIFGGAGGGTPLGTGGAFRVTDATWTPLTLTNAPLGRTNHSAVFTGQEMIVWGGMCDASCATNSGGRFNVGSKTWSPTALTPGVPTPRAQHKAVWTGSQMVVWGGWDVVTYPTAGGRYNPATDQWMPMATTGPVPSGRVDFTMAWDGIMVDVWGGRSGAVYVNTGARYNPATDTWYAVTTAGAPTQRAAHSAVWNGADMFVWGGWDGTTYLNDGARYTPGTDTWIALQTVGAPTIRKGHSAVWDGTRMIVWGGYNGASYLNSGGRFDAAGATWSATSLTGAPAVRADHAAVWTGTEMIVHGGAHAANLGDGGRYDPVGDSWVAVTTSYARKYHSAVWTGSRMLVFGGMNSIGSIEAESYNPTLNAWTPLSPERQPRWRYQHSAVWTGTEMLIWGGDNGNIQGSGGRYMP